MLMAERASVAVGLAQQGMLGREENGARLEDAYRDPGLGGQAGCPLAKGVADAPRKARRRADHRASW